MRNRGGSKRCEGGERKRYPGTGIVPGGVIMGSGAGESSAGREEELGGSSKRGGAEAKSVRGATAWDLLQGIVAKELSNLEGYGSTTARVNGVKGGQEAVSDSKGNQTEGGEGGNISGIEQTDNNTPPRRHTEATVSRGSYSNGEIGGGDGVGAKGGLSSTLTRTKAFRCLASGDLPLSTSTCGSRQEPVNGYVAHRDSSSCKEGFRNVGNTCYVNACLQGLLSLSGFMGDIQRECWVRAMRRPLASNDTGFADSSVEMAAGVEDVPSEAGEAVTAELSWQGTGAGGGGGVGAGAGTGVGAVKTDARSLYNALLRISLEARGPHGVMDAAPLKRAMDRHSDRFAGNLQQDAHEFLGDLINVLHDEMQPRLDAASAFHRESLKACGSTARCPSSSTAGDGEQAPSCKLAVGEGKSRDDDAVVDSSSVVSRATTGSGRGGERISLGSVACSRPHLKVSCSGEGGTSCCGAVAGRRSKGERHGVAVGHPCLGDSPQTDRRKREGKKERARGEAKACDAEDGRVLGKRRLMPTTRHFHAEVEVTLTCTMCAYSRQKRELYRDFSLDIPEVTEGGEGASGLYALLDGFFRTTELNLRCERCDHDRVRAQYALAELPGTLIVHVKRFKPVVVPPAAAKRSTPAGAAASGVGSGGNGVVGGGGGCAAGGISFVKVTTPVSVPLELNLERFCSSYTVNSPQDDLGKRVHSLEALDIPASASAVKAAGRADIGSPPSSSTGGGSGKAMNDDAGGGSNVPRSTGFSIDMSCLNEQSEEGKGGSGPGGMKRRRSEDGDACEDGRKIKAAKLASQEGGRSLRQEMDTEAQLARAIRLIQGDVERDTDMQQALLLSMSDGSGPEETGSATPNKKDSWECSACTLINTRCLTSCELCRTPRPTAVRAP